ncbi:MAG: hypothetical protein LJE96_18375 [Deltaproteobacteria bacterium]|nr:hypothetical protein [Deltaproteobacteria bacterium]
MGSILGASLGLLAFMLAFTFGMAGNIHDSRKQMILKEANAVGTLYLRAQLIHQPETDNIRQLLKEYVNVRIRKEQFKVEDNLKKAIKRSEELLEEMWQQCARLIRNDPKNSLINTLIIRSMNQVIDIHAERIAKAIYNRIPGSIRYTLLSVAILTMGMMGYHAGISRTRTLVARSGIILAITLVMLLIIDLDRPGEGLIEINQQAMTDLQLKMEKKF